MKYTALSKLTQLISQLPSIGPRSAKRISMHMASQPKLLQNLINAILEVQNTILPCIKCNNFDTTEICSMCTDSNRKNTLCFVRNHIDLYAIESTHAYRGYYILIGNDISPSSDEMIPLIDKIKTRINEISCEEIVIALPPSIENRIISQYFLIKLRDIAIKISTIGLGIPMGGSFEYMDTETITSALESRRPL